jgi:two-component system CheB/CheR fusion protein
MLHFRRRLRSKASKQMAGNPRPQRKKIPKIEPGTKTKPTRTQTTVRLLRVVGIGASAGGLKAFSQVLEHLPARSGSAFVFVQHLQPTSKSLLTGILSKLTSMTVREAKHGMRVQANCVYVIPRNANMTITRNVLRLSPRMTTDMPPHPIDRFLRSLAEDKHDRAIGVILSGTGRDGTLGLKAIKDAGGITFAQDEKSALYGGMPHNAINSGYVDFELTPARIAEELARGATPPAVLRSRQPAGQTSSIESDVSLKRILQLLRKATRLDFSQYEAKVFNRVIRQLMDRAHLDTLEAYAARLQDDEEEIEKSYRAFFSGASSFFRDEATFSVLVEKVFPEVVKRNRGTAPLRV